MTILSCCVDLFTERGPLPLETLAALVAGAGDQTRDPGAAVRNAISGRHGHVLVRDDDVCVAVRTLVTGRTFTHRLTLAERASDVVHAERDLDALVGPAHDGLALLEGGVLRSVRWPSAGLRGPKGWLRPHEPDAVLAFRLLPEGLEVRVVQIGAAEEARGRELAALLEPRLEPSWPSSWPGRCTAPLLPLLDSDPDLLREPAPPLGELLARHEPGDSVTPEEAWPSTARRQLGADPGGVLRHAADDLGVDPASLADALLCAVLSARRGWARFVAEPGCPSPRGAG